MPLQFEPPSPNALTAALTAISSEKYRPLSPCCLEFELGSGPDSAKPSDIAGTADGAMSPRTTNGELLPSLLTPEQSQEPHSDGMGHEEDEEALKESIRGVYRLWKVGRRNLVQSGTDEAAERDEKELFLRIVRISVDSP